MKIKFYGTRGSLPAPLTIKELRKKISEVVKRALQEQPPKERAEEWIDNLPFHLKGTFGGNTTCCVVRCGKIILVIDLGSGIREFGDEILPEMFANKGLTLHLLMTHVHWDHTQGFPFFAPIFVSQKFLPNNKFIFFGGTAWQKTLEEVLKGQMDPPVFPAEWEKIMAEGPQMEFRPIFDRFSTKIKGGRDEILARVRRLHHPNETYGWRIEYQGRTFAFATDTEPYANAIDPALLDIAQKADVLYLDCQYSSEQYFGKGGIARFGWGHGYDKWAGRVAKTAEVKHLVLGHHDPAANDEEIERIAENTRKIFPNVSPAYDGLELTL